MNKINWGRFQVMFVNEFSAMNHSMTGRGESVDALADVLERAAARAM